MIENIANISAQIFKIIIISSILFLTPRIVFMFLGFGKRLTYHPKKHKNSKFAILIPARDESNIIEELLMALSKQHYPKEAFDVYIIVKNSNDKSINLANKYGYIPLVCENQTCKGDALDFVIKHIYKNNLQYDSFVIFDADNVPTKTFLKEINKAYLCGYDIGIGYRNSKNWNDGWVATATGLTFSLINTLSNKGRTKRGRNCIFSGTGYFISKKVIDKFESWPFKTLTEDYEISLYATLNNLKTCYVENAEFFDEQPKTLKVSSKQRVRWVKGFTQANNLYTWKIFKAIFTDKKNRLAKFEQVFSVLPVIVMAASTIIYLLLNIGLAIASLIANISATPYFLNALKILLITYILLVIFTEIQFVAEAKRINVNVLSVITTSLLNPFYIFLYVPIGIKALLSKNIGWSKIEHGAKLKNESENLEEVYEDDEAREANKNA